jgi:hypothetical protein
MAQLPITVNLNAYRGDTWTQAFRFSKNGSPVDLSGLSIASWAHNPMTADTVVLEVVIDTDQDIFTIGVPTDIRHGTYDYDIEITDADGDVKTWVKGELLVERDVTNAN